MSRHNQILEIVTCSYRPDLERCSRLCASIDEFVDPTIVHTLLVPRRDREAFTSLENHRRRVLAVEAVVPGRYRQLPFSEKLWIDAWGWPLRGWVMQQLVKLSVSEAVGAELIVFADSDLQFIRPLAKERIFSGGKLRLHRVPCSMNEGRPLRWHARAAELLGESRDYFGSDYVGQLITWRRSNLVALHAHIESVTGRPWHTVFARSLDISEYILYGSFAEHVLGLETAGHFPEATDLCHCCWFDHQAQGLLNGTIEVAPEALALHVQSNLKLTPEHERAVFASALRYGVSRQEEWA